MEEAPGSFEKLSDERKGESSAAIRKRVTNARELQTERFKDFEKAHYNAQMNESISRTAKLSLTSEGLVKKVKKMIKEGLIELY